jgi:Ca-activated chloride channel family protein
MRKLAVIASMTWAGLWLTADQRGMRQFERGAFELAAETFDDPMWQGAAWYRAGAFEKAAQAYARRDTAEADFNQGNAWLMRGRYADAIAAYDRALDRRPEWTEASENRALAAARAKARERTGGEMGDQLIGADDVVFDKTKKPGGQDTELAGQQTVSDASVQAMWLRRVQTKPAEFLRSKFAYQHAMEREGAK